MRRSDSSVQRDIRFSKKSTPTALPRHRRCCWRTNFASVKSPPAAGSSRKPPSAASIAGCLISALTAALLQTAGILIIPLALFFTFCLTGTDVVTRLLCDPKAGLDFAALCSTVRFVLVVFVVRDLLEAGCHLVGGALTAALDSHALLIVRLAANVVWLTLLGAAFVMRPELSTYVFLTPLQMLLVLVPLVFRWYRRPHLQEPASAT